MKRGSDRVRLDLLLVERGLFPARSRAQAEIISGRVALEGELCTKAGTLVPREAHISVLPPSNPYVSRGGLKLSGALNDLGISVNGLTALDVGASTGGFTDCLLQNSASKVYALDVGYGQLDWRLRADQRVVVMERVNIRNLQAADLPETPQLATVDVSFISLKLVIPVLEKLGIRAILALIKPQFEVGRKEASRGKGVIRDPDLYRAILQELACHALSAGYHLAGLTFSRWPGPRGNIEFFAYWLREAHLSQAAASINARIDRLLTETSAYFKLKE